MIGSVILIVLGCLIVLGVGRESARDFGLPALFLILLIAAVVGLNFLPPFTVGEVTFSLGTLLLLASSLFFLIIKGTLKNRLICLLLTIVLAALLYGAIRLSDYFGVPVMNEINIYYGLAAGFIAFLFTRNTKYGFIAGVLSVAVASFLTSRNFDILYTPAVIAGALAATLYATASVIFAKRPNRMAYYFEIGRLSD